MLTNHIQTAHVEQLIEVVDEDQVAKGTESKEAEVVRDSSATELTRTGEVATLDTPFQCTECDKCFSHYPNFSNHMDHYHGYNRKCNVEGCLIICKSIQAYVQHSVQHGDPSFTMPPDFQAKTSVNLPCPLCNSILIGIWRFYNHTFTHDPIPRFKCPMCSKRHSKVQNFKLHLIKHRAPANTKTKLCRYCSQLVASSDYSRHVKELHKDTFKFTCDVCHQTFSRENFLNFHKEKHIPKVEWNWNCRICSQPFPSELRMKSHESSLHQNDPISCNHCNTGGFTNRLELRDHIVASHKKVFGCSECKIRDYSANVIRAHFRATHAKKPYICVKCEYKCFPTVGQMNKHVTSEHGNLTGNLEEAREEYVCNTCDTVFKQASQLLKHVKIVHLSECFDVNSIDAYKALSKTIPDHVIEFNEENQDQITRIHSMP
jgi:hypothetical protein